MFFKTFRKETKLLLPLDIFIPVLSMFGKSILPPIDQDASFSHISAPKKSRLYKTPNKSLSDESYAKKHQKQNDQLLLASGTHRNIRKRKPENDVAQLSQNLASKYHLDKRPGEHHQTDRSDFVTNSTVKKPEMSTKVNSSEDQLSSRLTLLYNNSASYPGRKLTHFPERKIIQRTNQNVMLKTMFPRIPSIRHGDSCPSQLYYSRFKNSDHQQFNGLVQIDHYMKHQKRINHIKKRKFRPRKFSTDTSNKAHDRSARRLHAPPNSATGKLSTITE